MESITSLLNQNTTPNFGPQGKSALGKDDFLKLMMEQIKNQDPLEPLDGSEYTAQLAQFSSLEQLSNMNESLNQSIDANYLLTQAVNNTLTAALIGKDAKVNSNSIDYNGQSKAQFGYTLPTSATTVTVKILDASGRVVKTFDSVPKTAGEHKLSWDFTDNEGEKVATGQYTFKVEATGANGEPMVIDTYSIGMIEAVRFNETGTALVINGVEYSLGEIFEILQSSNSSSKVEAKDFESWLKL